MRIDAANIVDMQGAERVIDEALEKFDEQIDVEIADAGAREVDVIRQSWPAGEVDHHSRQRLIQRHIGMAVAANADFVADRLRNRLAEGDADVFDGVMRIDMQIARCLQLDIDHAVARALEDHLIEKGHAGIKLRLALAVEIGGAGDLRVAVVEGHGAGSYLLGWGSAGSEEC